MQSRVLTLMRSSGTYGRRRFVRFHYAMSATDGIRSGRTWRKPRTVSVAHTIAVEPFQKVYYASSFVVNSKTTYLRQVSMSTEVRDYVSVSEKLKSFGVSVSSGLAILPGNLSTAKSIDDLRQSVESDTVRTLLRANMIAYVEIFDEDSQPPYLQQYGFEWFGPTLFISAGLLAQDPNVLSVTLGIITNYLYDLFKGAKDGKASLDVIFQQSDGSCKEIHYCGPPAGLSKVAEIVKDLGDK
jgi:hypothetical protein